MSEKKHPSKERFAYLTPLKRERILIRVARLLILIFHMVLCEGVSPN